MTSMVCRPAAPDTAPLQEMRAEIRALRACVDSLLAFKAKLEAGRGPRDWQDSDVLAAIAQTVGGRPFTSRELFNHAKLDADLRRAFGRADLTNAKTIGCFLRRMCNVAIDGREIQRSTLKREAKRRWCVSVVPVTDIAHKSPTMTYD